MYLKMLGTSLKHESFTDEDRFKEIKVNKNKKLNHRVNKMSLLKLSGSSLDDDFGEDGTL